MIERNAITKLLRMSIYDEVLSFIETPSDELFEPLGLKVFRHQFHHVRAYRQYCLQRGASPESVRSLDDVPPVSTVAFKYARLESDEVQPAGTAPRQFLTSGTTIGKDSRGTHVVARPEVYRASAVKHLRRMLFPDSNRMPILALHPTADRMPESSLSQMISWCIEEFGDRSLCSATRHEVACDEAIGFLESCATAGTPVCILGTTASFASLYATLRERERTLHLVRGSRMMDTGGAKGQIVPLTAHEVASEAYRLLAIDSSLVINEYGMTEMCSQMYDATPLNSTSAAPAGERLKLAPPWLRAVALDPVSLRPVADGQVGMLAFFDLANVGSVSAVMTEDFGVVENGGLRILGRAIASEPRGCALGIGQFASTVSGNPARTGNPR